jgi:ABC-2 type transport system permease protein
MMDKIILKILKLFPGLFSRQGVNVYQMFDIVETKLMMDKRRVHFQFRRHDQNKNENANRLTYVLLLYGFFSLFIVFMISAVDNIVLAMTIFHAYLLFMMSMTLITDFSSVLLDTADNLVILPRPVSGKTLFVSRMVHVSIYLFQFGVAISLIPVIATFVKFGVLAGLGSIITSFSTVLFSVFFTYLLYLLILRFSNEKKLREIVTYFQILMTILFMAGYQIIPRLIDLSGIESFSLHWYSYIAPPVWMAVALEAVYQNIYDTVHISMILLSIILPVILFWLLNKYFAPSFGRKLSAVQEDGTVQSTTKTGKSYKRKISERLSSFTCKSTIERASFETTWKISSRDKQFRLQFYPLLGYLVVFIFIFTRNDRGVDFWENLQTGNKFLWFIYIPLFMINSSLGFIAFNENYQAAWVYFSSPVDKPGHLLTGSLKTVFVKFFVPVFIILFGFSIGIWGIKIIDDFAFGLLININCFLAMASLSKHYLPFSMQPNVQQQSGKFINVVILFILIAIFIGLHWLGLLFPFVLYILMPILLITAYFMLRNLQQLKWRHLAI